MSLLQLVHVARDQAATIFCGLAFLAVATVAELQLPAVGGKLLDAYTSHAAEGRSVDQIPPSVESDLLHLVMLFATMAVAKHVGEYFLRLAGERTVLRVRARLFRALLASGVRFFDERPSATLVSVLTSDVQAIHEALTWHLPFVLRNGCMCAISAAHMAALSPRLTAIGATVAPLLGLLISAFGRIVNRLARQQQQQLGVASATAAEALASVRCVNGHGREATISHGLPWSPMVSHDLLRSPQDLPRSPTISHELRCAA